MEKANQQQPPDLDRQLLKEIKSGSYTAFNTLYYKYIKNLTNYGLHFTNDLLVIEDCLHDLFVWLWTKRETLDINSSLKNYLLKSVRTSIIHRINKEKKTISLDEHMEHESGFNLTLSPEMVMIIKENENINQQKLDKLFNLLTPKQKELIYLRYFEELNFEEIAQNLNITVKACYKLMGRAVSTLRQHPPETWLLLIVFSFLLHKETLINRHSKAEMQKNQDSFITIETFYNKKISKNGVNNTTLASFRSIYF